MLSSLVEYIFGQTSRRWKVGDKLILPNRNDIGTLIDDAIDRLYTEPVGTRLEKGGLIIEKTYKGHDVYAMVGSVE